MLVCLCKGVSDKKIKSIVSEGARSLREVIFASRAGSDCGACICDVKALVESCRAQCDNPCGGQGSCVQGPDDKSQAG